MKDRERKRRKKRKGKERKGKEKETLTSKRNAQLKGKA
jgi:hypothetical protein